jgi:hypothetical protein
MSTKMVTVGMGVLLLSLMFASVAQAQTRESLPNDFGAELLGKAALYSFDYQRMVTPGLGLQAGFAAIGSSDDVVVFFPVGAKLYVLNKNASPFVTGGIVLLTGSIDSGPVESATYGFAGVGFEFRSPGGFLFRGTMYGLFAGGEFLIWPGIGIGYAF